MEPDEALTARGGIKSCPCALIGLVQGLYIILALYKNFGEVCRKVGNAGHNWNNCLPHRSHDLYPGHSSV